MFTFLTNKVGKLLVTRCRHAISNIHINKRHKKNSNENYRAFHQTVTFNKDRFDRNDLNLLHRLKFMYYNFTALIYGLKNLSPVTR